MRAPELRSALGDVGDRVDLTWVYWNTQPTTTPIAVAWAPLTNVMAEYRESHHGLKVWVYPVAKRDHQAMRAVVEEQVLPDLTRWCREALAALEGWRLMRHERRWSVSGESVTAKERKGVGALRW